MSVVVVLGVVSLAIWLGIVLHPARPWDFQPVGDDEEMPPVPSQWPSVAILIPARNERDSLPHTLPSLLLQDYPGPFSVVVIDDRSEDGTAEIARQLASETGTSEKLTVISGASLPQGWVGKVWALEQGAASCGVSSAEGETLESRPSHVIPVSDPRPLAPGPRPPAPKYFLLTDADIRHAPGSLRRLVAESERAQLALNSRMARLRCLSSAERLLIPPYVFFFNLLYPMRHVNDPRSPVAAAAGGCVLLASAALQRAGGFACIKDRIIDDVSLAKTVKGEAAPIQLALSRTEVESLRVYESIATIWVMVRRTAFTELRYSWLRLAGTVAGIGLMFLVPPLFIVWGIGCFVGYAPLTGTLMMVCGLAAWLLSALAYRPAVRFFRLPSTYMWVLPLAGVLFGSMTIDSALRYATGRRIGWRDH